MLKKPEKILIIRQSSIGDILLTTPLLRILNSHFPKARIDFIIKKKYKRLLSTNPFIDTLYLTESEDGLAGLKALRSEIIKSDYDLLLDLHKNFKSYYLSFGLKTVEIRRFKKYAIRRFLLVKFGWNFYSSLVPVYKRYIRTCQDYGIQDDGMGLEFHIDQTVKESVQQQLKLAGYGNHRINVGIVPGAGYATKRWPVERYKDLVSTLMREKNAQCWILGDTNDHTLAKTIQDDSNVTIDLTGQLNLMQTACVISMMDILVTNDTGLMHLGNALKKPLVAIFGSTIRELGFYPMGSLARVVETSLSCRPCTHIGRKNCPKGHFKCMKNINVQDVFVEINNLLERKK